jgi:thioredoxin 1
VATDVTDASFQEEVIEGSKETPVLVDFWAEWCGPCHAVSPVLDKIAEERPGQLKLVKLNIDENQNTAQTYGVMSIPTMILFKDGEPAAATIGARPKGDIEKQLGLDPVSAA